MDGSDGNDPVLPDEGESSLRGYSAVSAGEVKGECAVGVTSAATLVEISTSIEVKNDPIGMLCYATAKGMKMKARVRIWG